MTDFARARTSEQKEMRMTEIKEAALILFDKLPYSEITLTKIADNLSWTRANLYRYVSTKEEIFLSLHEDCMAKYYSELNAAFPKGFSMSPEAIAEVWSEILSANDRYLMLGHILWAVVEANISAQQLVEFSAFYFKTSSEFLSRLSESLGISIKAANGIALSIYYHGMGLVCSSFTDKKREWGANPFGVAKYTKDFFKNEMSNYILMLIRYTLYINEKKGGGKQHPDGSGSSGD